MNRRSLLTVLVVVAVFVAGALAGALAVRFTGWWGPEPVAEDHRDSQDRDAGWRGFDDDDTVYEITRYLDEELGLSSDQETRVREILERRSESARELFRESRQRFVEHLDSTIAEVRTVLDSGQVEEYERILEEFEYRSESGGER